METVEIAVNWQRLDRHLLSASAAADAANAADVARAVLTNAMSVLVLRSEHEERIRKENLDRNRNRNRNQADNDDEEKCRAKEAEEAGDAGEAVLRFLRDLEGAIASPTSDKDDEIRPSTCIGADLLAQLSWHHRVHADADTRAIGACCDCRLQNSSASAMHVAAVRSFRDTSTDCRSTLPSSSSASFEAPKKEVEEEQGNRGVEVKDEVFLFIGSTKEEVPSPNESPGSSSKDKDKDKSRAERLRRSMSKPPQSIFHINPETDSSSLTTAINKPEEVSIDKLIGIFYDIYEYDDGKDDDDDNNNKAYLLLEELYDMTIRGPLMALGNDEMLDPLDDQSIIANYGDNDDDEEEMDLLKELSMYDDETGLLGEELPPPLIHPSKDIASSSSGPGNGPFEHSCKRRRLA